ncbi:putative Zn-dependent protease [Orbus hercynius]|uniref:Putative beta-barrel assembly-enhancing protease n=1 Tax=Orbus hercynius TaxID=593135 RepID=A0A495RK75_9GAMM|nr:M48 family metalloprotease [Orbus hercynius]RKS87178.1 putative Zn-dependent protease [Orbus hercynius]
MKKCIALFLSASMLFPAATIPVRANNINLPDIGTTAAATLSIGQEIEMGDYYTRMLRGSAPIINDPMLNEYINSLGSKLVAHADSVQTPFHFYIMQSDVLNAFAYFGGNVVVHSRLIIDTDDENQLASVMAHEIGHVTQRHLARAMEARNKNSPYIWGATLGSLLLALANPEAGIAAISGTIAGSAQSQISFTQSNEQEADRVGLRTLAKSGFEPAASASFLQKLSDETRFMSKPPEMLLTHPLPDSRLSDVRSRANQYPKKHVASSLDYYLAKARLVALIGNNKNAVQLLLKDYQKIDNPQTKIAITYTAALIDYRGQNYSGAKAKLQPLLEQDPTNVWFVDLMTDLDLSLNNKNLAISRLQAAIKANPNNTALQLNLANSYIENQEYQKATGLLHRYTHEHSDDINGWDLLVQAYENQRQRAQEMAARAEIIALQGQYPQAINLLQNAKNQAQGNSLLLARFDARITDFQQLQTRYAAYKR